MHTELLKCQQQLEEYKVCNLLSTDLYAIHYLYAKLTSFRLSTMRCRGSIIILIIIVVILVAYAHSRHIERIDIYIHTYHLSLPFLLL